jgi:hypothetical protein
MQNDLQMRLLDMILERYERRSDGVDDLCRILNSTKNPVYRRLRGETLLSPQEISILAHHYNISIDRLIFENSSKILCSFKPISHKVKDFNEYLHYFLADFEIIRKLPNAVMYGASAEIPVLACAYFPELLCFKLYVWGRTSWDFEYLRDRPFSFDLLTEPVRRQIKDVMGHYNQLSSIELLNVSTMDITLAQIEYQVYSHGFKDPQEALRLCDILQEFTTHLKAMTVAGRKFDLGSSPSERAAKIDLYHNEIFFTTNISMVKSDLGPVVHFTYNGPNFMRTTDEKFCAFTDKWFKQVMSKSSPMTHVAERTRDWFFRELSKKIERVKQRIVVHLDVES